MNNDISENTATGADTGTTGAFVNLNPYIEQDHLDMSQFPKVGLAMGQYKGDQCMLPALADSYGLYYNTDMFQKAGIKVDHESISQKATDFSSLVAKVTPQTTVVVLPWQVAANAQQFGKNLAEQHKNATIVGTDGTFSPSAFTTPGSYVSSFGPDITAIPSDASIVAAAKAAFPKFGTFGPPVYAATHVLDEAIAKACKSGTPSRDAVLAAVKSTSEGTSILGQPIHFDTHGDMIGAKWFLFKINSQGKYTLVTGS